MNNAKLFSHRKLIKNHDRLFQSSTALGLGRLDAWHISKLELIHPYHNAQLCNHSISEMQTNMCCLL